MPTFGRFGGTSVPNILVVGAPESGALEAALGLFAATAADRAQTQPGYRVGTTAKMEGSMWPVKMAPVVPPSVTKFSPVMYDAAFEFR